jgi:hypothetical protein
MSYVIESMYIKPLLCFLHLVPFKRIVLIGTPASGKSVLAKRYSDIYSLPLFDMESRSQEADILNDIVNELDAYVVVSTGEEISRDMLLKLTQEGTKVIKVKKSMTDLEDGLFQVYENKGEANRFVSWLKQQT